MWNVKQETRSCLSLEGSERVCAGRCECMRVETAEELEVVAYLLPETSRLCMFVPRVCNYCIRLTRTAGTRQFSSRSKNMAALAGVQSNEPLFRLNFQLSAEKIHEMTGAIVDKYTYALDGIVSASDGTFQNTFSAFAFAESDAVIQSSQVTLPGLTSTDAAAREASSTAKQTLRDMWNKAYGREDLYQVLKGAFVQNENDGSLDAEDVRFMRKTLSAFEQNGVGLGSSDVLARYGTLNEACGKLTAQYEQNINEDTSVVLLSKAELDGCKKSLLEGLPTSEDPSVPSGGELYEVSMKAPTRIPVMQYAVNSDTRKKTKLISDKRCMQNNGPLLEEILQLRMDKAKLLGFENHAEYMLKEKMVGNLQNAKKFLMDIHKKIRSSRDSNIRRLSDRKKADLDMTETLATSSMEEEEEEGGLNPWDIHYYERLIKEETLNIDSERVREYFPMEHTKENIFSIYQEFLGVKYKKLTDDSAQAVCWHDEVDLYEVRDVVSDEVCGHFFLDLFSRDGKFGHQCVVPIVPSCHAHREDGGGSMIIKPACAILGNMTKPTATRPSLLSFAEVHTFFHEFGHVMHAVLTTSKYTRFSWTWPMMPWPGGVEQDFLEVPSMFLEKLVYESDILQKLSSHYETGEALDAGTIAQLQQTQHFLVAKQWSRFIGLALFDLEIHSQSPPYSYVIDHGDGIVVEAKDLTLIDLWRVMMSDLSGMEETEGTFMPAQWYHLVIGYDAGYYGYLYSEVFAHAILEEVKCQKAIDGYGAIGAKYRKHILEPGATTDGFSMLRSFLGKEPDDRAFLKDLGIAKPSRKLLTLVLVVQDSRILLAEKKRGFGAGYFNGFGGKVEKGETILEAAHREMREESTVDALDIERRGVLHFNFQNEDGKPVEKNPFLEVHVYKATSVSGSPQETEEMRPFWHSLNDPIPYDKMWQDDIFWYPLLLEDKCFLGKFDFVNTTTMVSHEVKEVDKLPFVEGA